LELTVRHCPNGIRIATGRIVWSNALSNYNNESVKP